MWHMSHVCSFHFYAKRRDCTDRCIRMYIYCKEVDIAEETLFQCKRRGNTWHHGTLDNCGKLSWWTEWFGSSCGGKKQGSYASWEFRTHKWHRTRCLPRSVQNSISVAKKAIFLSELSYQSFLDIYFLIMKIGLYM